MTEFDPTEHTVAEITEYVDDVDDAETLDALIAAEEAGDERVTAIDAIEERLDAVTEADEAADALEETKEVLEGSDAKEAADERPESYITIKNPNGRGAHIAGMSFEPYEAKRVPNSNAIRTALRNGNLQFVKNG